MSYNQISSQEFTSTSMYWSVGPAERLIKNAWENKKLASSYLFFGPEGTGRFSLAFSLAKTVNCLDGSFPPCSICSSCMKIEKNNHPDVHLIQKDNSSFIKIEQIHQMQREISMSAFEGKYKVFVILNAEDLTAEAANSLLKVLEEPPRNSLIILIVSDITRIFPTIVSRCQKIRFYPIDPHQAEIILNRDYHLNKSLSHFLAFIFEGRIGEALKFKDRNILNEKNQIIRQFIISPNSLFNKFEYRDRDELNWILKILISCARDIYLLKIGRETSGLINQDLKDQLWALTGKFSFAELEQMLYQLSDNIENIRQNINPRLLVDNLRLLWRK
jgi:DNA polymerase-3 subunit delta'